MFKSMQATVVALAAALSASAHARAGAEDARITMQVQERIDERPQLRFHHIAVYTVDHDVYLEGLVDTRIDRGEAARLARSVPGVRRVYNELALFNG